jgi:CheY-like chemotaxis protein/HPt (histidine-containing phosphotransfer) domain-containing protein
MEGSITMSDHKGMKPRLLLVEDDPISRSFMAAALEALPAQVDTADSMRAALALEGVHDLWLVDANLPDGHGTELLAKLRLRLPTTPALAHTADDSPALQAKLLDAGFAGVLVKPLSAARLQEVVRRWLGTASGVPPRISEAANQFVALPLWDEAAALAALNGSQEHVATLRRMFLDELMRQHDAILYALNEGDPGVAKQILHQLKASSGFVGALRLHAAAKKLEDSLSEPSVAATFTSITHETLASG